MEIIVADSSLCELGILRDFTTFDCVNSKGYEKKDNDFEIKMTVSQWDKYQIKKGYFLYVNGTEFGGEVEGITVNGNVVTLNGITWRGMLSRPIIANKAYNFSGEANSAILSAVSGQNLPKFFIISRLNTGVSVSSTFEFPKLLQAVTEGLGNSGMRLDVNFYNGVVTLKASRVVDRSNEIDISQDYSGATIKATDDISTFHNHYIAVGKGGLLVQRWMDTNGNLFAAPINQEINRSAPIITSENETDTAKLVEQITKKAKDNMPRKTIEMNLNETELNVELGDKVSGRERVTGFEIKGEIFKKILRIEKQKNKITLNYEVK